MKGQLDRVEAVAEARPGRASAIALTRSAASGVNRPAGATTAMRNGASANDRLQIARAGRPF